MKNLNENRNGDEYKKNSVFFYPYGDFIGQANGRITTQESDIWCDTGKQLPLTITLYDKKVTGIMCSSTLQNDPKALVKGANGLREVEIDFQNNFQVAVDNSNIISGHFLNPKFLDIGYKSSNGLSLIYGCTQNDVSSNIRCNNNDAGINADSYKAFDFNGDGRDDILYLASGQSYVSTNNSPNQDSVGFSSGNNLALPQLWKDNFIDIHKANFTYSNVNDLYLQVNRMHYVLINHNNELSAFSSDANGLLDLKNQGTQWFGDCWKVVLGDFDGNGISDLAAFGYGEVSLMLNDNFKFGNAPQKEYYKINTYPYREKLDCVPGKADRDVSVLDVNGDNKDDIICYKQGNTSSLFVSDAQLVDSKRYNFKVEFDNLSYGDQNQVTKEDSLLFQGTKILNVGVKPVKGDISIEAKFKTATVINLNQDLFIHNLHKAKELSVEIGSLQQEIIGQTGVTIINGTYFFSEVNSHTDIKKFTSWKFFSEHKSLTLEVEAQQCSTAAQTFKIKGYNELQFNVVARVSAYDLYNKEWVEGAELSNIVNGMLTSQATLNRENSEIAEFEISGIITIPMIINSNILVSNNCPDSTEGILSGLLDDNTPILGQF